MKETAASKVYFENLNAIRFIAAFFVIVSHIEQFKKLFGLPNYWGYPVFHLIGKLGVILFFVLSGFLISFLLMKEESVTGTINIRYFYIRRILRIWPLYFLIILCSLFLFPFVGFLQVPGFDLNCVWSDISLKMFFFVFFLPNLVLILYGMIPFASQTWSIGAEEQFYLIWPWLNQKVRHKWALMCAVIAGYLCVEFVAPLLNPYVGAERVTLFLRIWSSTPVDCMAIGGLFACLVSDQGNAANRIRRILFHPSTQWFALLLLAFMVIKACHFKYLHYELYSLLFGIMIANFAANESRIFSMEFRPLAFLGAISYGLYIYHPIAIVVSIKIYRCLGWSSTGWIEVFSLLGVIVISAVSYELFEKRFIILKHKYAKIVSGQ